MVFLSVFIIIFFCIPIISLFYLKINIKSFYYRNNGKVQLRQEKCCKVCFIFFFIIFQTKNTFKVGYIQVDYYFCLRIACICFVGFNCFTIFVGDWFYYWKRADGVKVGDQVLVVHTVQALSRKGFRLHQVMIRRGNAR